MISYQLYSSRNFPPVAQTLKMLESLGYDAAEGYGMLYSNQAELDVLAAALAATELKMPSGHFSIEMLEQTPDFVLHVAKTLGMGQVIVPWLPPEDRPSDAAGWRALGARLQKAGAKVWAAGLKFGWHNHDFEFIRLPDGTVPMDALFEGGPDLGWEIDVAWVVRGGANPVEWISNHAKRVIAAHVKDIPPAGQNRDEDGWSDVGQGIVPWRYLYNELAEHGVENFVIEHDNPADHARFARNSLMAVKAF
jgi:sugar phosphate isomerase/epimerase